MRLWPFSRKPDTEQRDVQYSPNFSVYLAAQSRPALGGSGVNVTPDTALRMMAVRACVRVISEDVASLPLQLNRRLSRGKERATAHPLYPLLHDAPNPEMSAFQFREMLQAHVLLRGNGFAEIVPGPTGYPAALWPIPPQRVRVYRSKEGSRELFYEISPPGGEKVRLPAERVLHMRGLSLDGVMGLSPIDDARETIGLGMAAETFAGGFFSNGARPSVVFRHPLALSPEAHKNLLARLEEDQTGLNNAQRISLLEEGMDVKQLTVSPENAQFIEQRKFSVEEIARLYRVHPHKIGVMEGTQTYASVEQANIDHVVSTIRPWCVRWEQEMNRSLIPPEERGEFFTEFVTAGLLRGDHAGRANFYRTLWNLGALSQNDIRELENQNPIEGGDTYYVPLNVMPAGSTPLEQAQRVRMLTLLASQDGAETRQQEADHAFA